MQSTCFFSATAVLRHVWFLWCRYRKSSGAPEKIPGRPDQSRRADPEEQRGQSVSHPWQPAFPSTTRYEKKLKDDYDDMIFSPLYSVWFVFFVVFFKSRMKWKTNHGSFQKCSFAILKLRCHMRWCSESCTQPFSPSQGWCDLFFKYMDT